ncbi:hypothetical protein F4804DRAFT_323832 [Jackrogersella minutella]|nr:hypothetical protein F4804DRAFT_323832 [Jackrogersella minutella]
MQLDEMATPDNSSRDDGEVVIVTLILRPSDPHVTAFPKRQFILSRQNSSVRIGRASKVPTKGFVASIDNAWFDSPVMSRQHAEISLDYDTTPWTVFIKDIGSLHGTFHTPHDGDNKESRLEQDKSVRLSNGDLLRFGTDIFRSSETFPPCHATFFIEDRLQHPHIQTISTIDQSTNRVFTIPDDIDDEDDEEDDDSAIETMRLPDTQKGASIDLTRDEAEVIDDHTAYNNVTSDVIDLTSEPDERLDPEPDAMSRHHSISTVAPAVPATVTVSGSDSPTATDHSPKPMSFSDAPGSFYTEPPQPYIHYPTFEDSSSEDIVLTDSDNNSIITRDSADDLSVVGEGIDIDMEDDEDGENSLASEYSDDSRGGFGIWEDDHESLEDLPYSDDITSSSSGESMDSASNSSSPILSSPSLPLHSSDPPAPKEATATVASADSSDAKPPFVTPFLFTTSVQQEAPAAHPRDPSPSDAAMFKRCPIIDRAPSDSRAHALGEKSGKYEYFAARENNRMALGDQLSTPMSAIRESLTDIIDDQIDDLKAERVSHSSLPDVRADGDQTKSTQEVVEADNATEWPVHTSQGWFSGGKFINNPQSEDLPHARFERPQSPELDMTSAYTFQLSKLATGAKPRRVGIQDLLTQESSGSSFADERPWGEHPEATTSASLTPARVAGRTSHENGLKRSFDDAFIEEDVLFEVSGNADEAHIFSNGNHNSESTSNPMQYAAAASDELSRATTSKVPFQQGEPQGEPVSVSIQLGNAQPSKRRRFAQAAACVALGGAAAFTFMVSTAPVL